jgi:L-iditol 2-dehydrogenase
MQALLLTAIKELQLVEAPLPVVEQPDWVLVKVRSVGICGSDLHGYAGHSGRRIPPLIMGHEATGEVVEVGETVTNLSPGDRVAMHPIYDTGMAGQEKERLVLGMSSPGAYADYVTWPASSLFRLPEALSYEQGALAEPLAITVHAVSLAHIQPYDTAFIVGAGPIGLLTLAVLRSTGVSRIAVSDTSAPRLELAKTLGAQVLINPTRQDPREVVDTFTAGQGVDVAFEAVGLSATCRQTVEVTRDRGTIIWIGNNHVMVEINMQLVVTRELKVLGSYGMTDRDFQRALQMLADGIIPTGQLINRRASLSEGPELFDELLASPETIKCVINFPD